MNRIKKIRAPSDLAMARIKDIKAIQHEAKGKRLTLQHIADKLGEMNGRQFSRQYIKELVDKYKLLPPVKRLQWKICPGCGGQKKYESKLCITCYRQRQQRVRSHHLVCPICGNAKVRQSNRCVECRDARREVPSWFNRDSVPV